MSQEGLEQLTSRGKSNWMSQLLVPPPPPLPSTANASHGKLDFFTPSKKTPFSDVTNGQAPQRALATGAKRIPAPQVTMKGGLGHGMGELPEHLRSVGDKDKEKNHYMKPTEAFKHALEDPSVTPNRPKKSVVPTAKVAQASPARVRPSLASKAVREDASVRSNHSKVVVPSITKIMDNAPKRVMPIVEQHLQTPTRPTSALKQRSTSTPPSSKRPTSNSKSNELVDANVHHRLYAGSTMGTRAREAARSSSTKGHFFDPRSQTQQTRIAGGATTPTNTAHMHTQDTHNILFSPQSILKRSLSNGQLDLLAAEAQETASYRPRAQSTPKPRPKALTFALQEKSQALSIQAMQTTEVKKDVVGLERKHSTTMLVSPTEKASIHKKPASPSDAFQHNHSTHNTVVTPTSAAKKGNQLKAQKRPAQSSVSADKLSANKAAKRATMMKITSATPATNARYSSGTAASQGKAKEVSRAPVASSGNTPKSNQKPTPTRKTNASIPVTSSSMPMSSKFATTNGSSIIRASIAPEEEEQYAGQEVDESLNKTHYAEEILRVVAQCDNHHSPKNTQPNPSMTAVSTKPVNYDILFDEANDSLSAIEGNQSLLSTLAGNMDDLLSQNMLSFQASIDTQQTQNTLEAAAAALEEEEEGNDEEDEEEEERPAVLTVMPQPRTTTLMLDTHSYDNAEDLSIVQPATYSPHNLSNVSTFSNGGDFSPFIRPYSPSNNMIFSSNGLNSNTAKAIIHSHAQKPPTVLRRSASNNSATETLLSLTHNKPGVPGNSASSLRRQVSHDDNSWAQDYIAILEAGQQSSMQQPREASSPLMIQVPSSSSFQTHHAKHRASPSPSTTTTTPSNSLVLNTAMILSRADSFASQMDFLDISAINPCNQSTNQLHSMPTFSIMNPLSITNQTIDITTMDVLGDDLDKENVSPLPTPSFVVREASPRPPLQVINELSVLEDDDHYVVDEEEDVDGANLADVAFLQSQSRSLLTQSSSPEQHKAQLPADHSGSAFDKEENDSLTLQDSSRSTSSLAPPALDRSIDFEPRNHLPLQSMPPMMSLTVASKASKPCSFSEIEARNSSASNEMRSPSRFVHTASPARNSAGPVVNSTASSGMGKFDYMTMDVSYVVIPPNTDHHREVDHEAPVAMISDEGEEEEDEENVSFDLNDEHGFDDEEEDGVDESAEEIDSGNDFDPDDDEELGESTLMSLDFSSRLDNHKLYLQQQGRFDFFQHDAAPSVQLPEDYQEDEGDYENDISDDTYEHYASEKQDSIGPLRHFRIEESSISIATNKSASSYSSSMEELTSMTAGPCIAYAYLEESLNSSVGMADLSQHHNTSYGLSASNVRRGSRSPLKGVHREAASNTSPRAKTPISIEQVEQQQLQDAAFCPDPVAVQLYNNSHASPATEHLQINGLARTFIPLRLHEEEQE